MSVTISGDTGVSKVQANAVEAGDIAAGAVSQANLAAGVGGNGPAFAVNLSSTQVLTTGTETKLQYGSELWDTNSCFDAANYRFLPTVAGYYHITANVYVGLAASSFLSLYKNGSVYMRGSQEQASQVMLTFSGDVYLNGSTDYVEIYLRNNSGGSITADTYGFTTVFSGFLTRAA